LALASLKVRAPAPPNSVHIVIAVKEATRRNPLASVKV
jgi:hypothetical protein